MKVFSFIWNQPSQVQIFSSPSSCLITKSQCEWFGPFLCVASISEDNSFFLPMQAETRIDKEHKCNKCLQKWYWPPGYNLHSEATFADPTFSILLHTVLFWKDRVLILSLRNIQPVHEVFFKNCADSSQRYVICLCIWKFSYSWCHLTSWSRVHLFSSSFILIDFA